MFQTTNQHCIHHSWRQTHPILRDFPDPAALLFRMFGRTEFNAIATMMKVAKRKLLMMSYAWTRAAAFSTFRDVEKTPPFKVSKNNFNAICVVAASEQLLTVALIRMCSMQRVLLNLLQNSQEITSLDIAEPPTLIKKRF